MAHYGRLIALVLLALSAMGLGSQAQPSEADAVRKSTSEFVRLWNSHDGKALASCWGADGDFVGFTGERIAGRTDLEHAFRLGFGRRGSFEEAKLSIDVDIVRLVTPDVAIEDWSVVIEGARAEDGSKKTMTRRWVVVRTKHGEQWLIAAARSFPMDEGQPTTTPQPEKQAATRPAGAPEIVVQFQERSSQVPDGAGGEFAKHFTLDPWEYGGQEGSTTAVWGRPGVPEVYSPVRYTAKLFRGRVLLRDNALVDAPSRVNVGEPFRIRIVWNLEPGFGTNSSDRVELTVYYRLP